MGTRLLATIVMVLLLLLFIWGAAAIVGVTFWQALGCNIIFAGALHGLIKLLSIIVKD